MKLLDRFGERYRQTGYWEGMASGAAVLMPLESFDGKKESSVRTLTAEALQHYSTNGIVFALIQVRAMLMAEARFCFQDMSDGDLSNLPPRAEILEYPWPNGDTGELWHRLIQDADIFGNAFLWRAEPDHLVRLPPDEVSIISEWKTAPNGAKYKNPIGYDWDPKTSSSTAGPAGAGMPQTTAGNLPGLTTTPAHTFTVDEIVHWSPYPDPMATFRGMSWLTPVMKDIRADNGLGFYLNQYVDHGHPIIAIKYAQRFRPETVDSVVNRFMTKYSGLTNAFKPIVLDQGADPIVGPGLKELDLAAIRAVGEERLCAAAGVPPEIMGLREAKSENYMAAMRRFADLTCRPLWRSACASLEKLISVPSGSRLWYDTTSIAALQAAETERAQVMQVSAAATLTLIQAGMERKSVIAAISTGDYSLLKPDPNAPTPGVVERETVQVGPLGEPLTGPEANWKSGVSGTAGKPPGGGQVLTQPQTGASKTPMPGSIPTTPSGNGKPARPQSLNRG